MWSTDFATRGAAGVLDQEPLYEFPRSEEVGAVPPGGLEGSPRRRDRGRACGASDAPVLVLHGERDPGSRVGAREVAELAPLGEWAPLAAAGHSPWLEQPAAMRERLRGFIGPIAGSL